MATTSLQIVKSRIFHQLSMLAAMKSNLAAEVAGWSVPQYLHEIADGSADDTYRNEMFRSSLTALDARLQEPVMFDITLWGTLHNNYAKALGYAGFDEFLLANRIRVPEYLTPDLNLVLSAASVAADGDDDSNKLATITAPATGAGIPVTAASPLLMLSSSLSPTVLRAKLTTVPTGNPWVLTIPMKITTSSAAVNRVFTFPTGLTNGDSAILGESSLASGSLAVGATTMTLSSGQGAWYQTGQSVWLADAVTADTPDTLVMERVTLSNVAGDVLSFTATPLLNAYSSSALIAPMFMGMTAPIATAGNTGVVGVAEIRPQNDYDFDLNLMSLT